MSHLDQHVSVVFAHNTEVLIFHFVAIAQKSIVPACLQFQFEENSPNKDHRRVLMNRCKPKDNDIIRSRVMFHITCHLSSYYEHFAQIPIKALLAHNCCLIKGSHSFQKVLPWEMKKFNQDITIKAGQRKISCSHMRMTDSTKAKRTRHFFRTLNSFKKFGKQKDKILKFQKNVLSRQFIEMMDKT